MKKNLKEITRQFMRVSTIFLGIMLVSAGLLEAKTGSAQKVKGMRLSIAFHSQTLAGAIADLEKATHLSFAYDRNKLQRLHAPDTAFRNTPLDHILTRLLSGTVYSYDVINDNITIGRDFDKVLQQIPPGSLSGRVTDSGNGEPLPGASVRLQETNKGAIADGAGNFKLEGIPPGKYTVIVSSIGYEAATVKNVEIKEGTPATLDVVMKVKNNLSEVVVTALGIRKDQNSLSYATSTVQGEDFTKAREPNIANALEGKVAGVNVVKPVSGAMGSSRVVIRGNGSISGNNQPLYVIDGIPLVNNTYGQTSVFYGGSDGGDGISSIDPDDIETMALLDGGAASALYGGLASNGDMGISTEVVEGGRELGV